MMFEGIRRNTLVLGQRGSWWLLPCLLLGACSILLDTQKKQCDTDEDCWARGLDGALCVRELCQPAAATSGSTNAPSSTGPLMASTPSETPRADDRDRQQAAPATMSGQGPRVQAATAGAVSSSAGAAASVAGMSARASAGAAGGCEGRGCPGNPECKVDADCEALGMAGSTCINAICWSAEGMCEADGDCLVMGPEYAGGRCLSTVCWPNPRWRCEATPVVSTSEQKELSVLVRDSLSLNPLPMVHLLACSKLDVTCASPVADGTTGSDGQLKITLPANFAGYLQQTERMEYAPAMYFLPPVLPEDGVLQPFPLLSSGAILDALATTLGAELEPDRGNMMLIAEDCMGTALAGATFMSPQADDKTVQFYVRNLLPSTTEKETAEIGNGGYLNFPAGTAVIHVDRVEGMLHLATVTVTVRAGFISVAYMRPQLRAPLVP
jgi:hypothetical protein